MMSSIELCTSLSLSRTSSLLSSSSPISKFPPPNSLSPSLISSSLHSLSLSLSTSTTVILRHRLSNFSLIRSSREVSGNYRPGDEDEEEELFEFEDVEGNEELFQFEEEEEEEVGDLDAEALELEAIQAAREYSLSLSRELTIEDEPDNEKGTRRREQRRKAVSVNIPDHLLPKVAIVGRPNVGKSRLFNRLVGGNKAIVVDEPGVTRDRLYGRSYWGLSEFMVVDTGGVLTLSKSQDDVLEDLAVSTTIGMEGIPLPIREAAVARMPSMIEKQAIVAVEESSVIIFLVDGQYKKFSPPAVKHTYSNMLGNKFVRPITVVMVENDIQTFQAMCLQSGPLHEMRCSVIFPSAGASEEALRMIAIIGEHRLLSGQCYLYRNLSILEGVTAADVEIANWLRKNYSDKTIVLAVNKCESPRKGFLQASEFWSLGFSPLPISAISGTGVGELLDLVCSGLQKPELTESLGEEKEDYVPAISIVGRPNVGKSSILNALVGEDRTIVSPVSGTTRDAIDTEFTAPDGQKFQLIDTAGIRKRTSVASSGSTTESLSVNRAFRAIRRSDVVALVIEALACITEQDYKIAERIEKEGKGCLIVVNKWDTIPNKNQQTTLHYEDDVRLKLRILNWAPIVYSTAIVGRSVEKIIVAASMVEKERSRRLSTATLNQVIQEALAFKSPPRTRGGKRGRIYYCTQAAIRPPTFVFFVNDAKLFSVTYRRYMEKQLRSDAGFPGTPIRLLWRSRRKMGKGEGRAPPPKTHEGHLKPRNKKLAAAT